MSEDNKAVKDTAGMDPEPNDQAAIEFVDPVNPPAPEKTPSEGQKPLIYGKYKSQEDADRGFSELEKEKGRLAQELGDLRRIVGEMQQRGNPDEGYNRQAPSYNPQVSNREINDNFREQLERDPWGTLVRFSSMIAEHTYGEKERARQQMLQEYQKYAVDPTYADVASEASQLLPFAQPISPVEGAFLRSKVKMLEAAMQNRDNPVPSTPAPAPHFEAGGANPSASPGLRIELDEKSAMLRRQMGEERFNRVARTWAQRKANGENTREWSIDDYTRGMGNNG